MVLIDVSYSCTNIVVWTTSGVSFQCSLLVIPVLDTGIQEF
ncbi:hypothetical protein [Wolbachia endosymbiont (group A) of Cheilosia soror]|nr:hypothetical protein [Wolbachia endosymbiont (group A) of Cheilosia soror]